MVRTKGLGESFSEFFSYLRLDTRSLSAFRVLFGISILYNIVVIKWSFTAELLGSTPFLPFGFLDSMSGGPDYSIFQIESLRTDAFIGIYMWLYLAAALLFTAGIKTRWVTPIIFFFQFNIIQGANVFCTGVDHYNLHLVFWSMFLPLDRHFTLLKSKNTPRHANLSVSFVLLLQISTIYFFSYLFKYGTPWQEGYAAKLMLMSWQSSHAVAGFFLKHDFITTFITYTTLLIEFAIPFLLLVRWRWRALRITAAFALLSFHFFIALSSDVSGYSFTGFAVGILLLPDVVWQRLKIPDHSGSLLWIRGYAKTALLVLSLFCSVIIVQKATINLYKSYDDERTVKVLEEWLVPSPAKASVFTQNWNMFAPNPPRHIGGFGIAERQQTMKGGMARYDFVYNQTLIKGPMRWERIILDIMKISFYKMSSTPGSGNVISFWADWKVRSIPTYNNNPQDYLFVEFRRLLDYDNKDYIPTTDTIYYQFTDLLNGVIQPL